VRHSADRPAKNYSAQLLVIYQLTTFCGPRQCSGTPIALITNKDKIIQVKWGRKMDIQKNEHISKALEIANNLMCLANNEVGLADEGSCGILSGVCRDCAYKIRRQAEHAALKTRMNWCPSASPILIIFAAALLSIVFAAPVNATIILSTDATETLGGATFDDGDLAEYEPTTDTAALYFDENLFGSNENINAVHVLGNGNIILSTASGAALGGLTFENGDLIEYNPTTDVGTLYLDGSLFVGGNEDIDGVHILDNGNIILSTLDAATLGGMSFGESDLAEYNPTTDIATLFFDGNLFGASENIDAVHVLGNGNIILSTVGAATLGGLTFIDGDLVEYNPTTDVATLYFSEALFSNNADVDAVYVTTLPEPATIALLGFGCLVLVRRRHA